MAQIRQSFIVVVLMTLATTTCWAIFIGSEQDVGSPLRVAQCRATCLERFSNDGPKGESMCLQGPDCFMCWENCELLHSNFQVWGAMCEEAEICFPGCQAACRFHANASTHAQQTQPVIHTKGEDVIQVNGAVARWPRPVSIDGKIPLVYVVMIKFQGGVWHEIIQTLDVASRVPINWDKRSAMLRVLVVDSHGLVTIYSPNEVFMRKSKRKKTINTEIKPTTRNPLEATPWKLRELSLIHQKVLVIGEIAWNPQIIHGIYLVTWEVDGGGLKGNLFTDSTCVTLSLWPDTVYHIQVELVSRAPSMENLKSEMLNLDTGRAQKVSTEGQERLKILSADVSENMEFNAPLLSILSDRTTDGNNVRTSKFNLWNNELFLGIFTGFIFFIGLFIFIIFSKCRTPDVDVCDILIGTTSHGRQKLVEDPSAYTDIKPVVTMVPSSDHNHTAPNETSKELGCVTSHSKTSELDKTVLNIPDA